MAKPNTLSANAWAAAASDQTIKRKRIADARAELVHHPAGEQKADRVGEIERSVDVPDIGWRVQPTTFSSSGSSTPSTARST